MRWWWCAARVLNVAAALLLGAGLPLAGARACDARCVCRADSLACSHVPALRLAAPPAVRHVSVAGARLGTLPDAALDARRLTTLVLVGSRLHTIEPHALSSMESTLASLDLGYNEFTEVPLESLRELKVLNWLNMQNNYICELNSDTDWGFLADSLSTLVLSNNHLLTLRPGALTSLRQLAQLDLEGNRLHAVWGGALPGALALLRLSDNVLGALPCVALAALPRLRHLHLRNNVLRASTNRTCHAERSRVDSLDISHNELDDSFELEFQHRSQLKQLILDFNYFTSVPSFVLDSAHLVKLSIAYNRMNHLSEAAVHALKRNLERLELDHNELAALPACIAEMVSLRYLSVAYNRLTEVEALPPHLHTLSLAGNYLTTLPVALHALAPASLAYLDMGYNLIAEVRADEFGAWAGGLATLNLRANRVATLAADAFPNALPLRELVLSFNELYFVDAAAFANLSALHVLELSTALVSGEFPLAAPPSLSWLSLDNNNIHLVTADHILNFPLLEYLNLDFNKIVEFPSEVFSPSGSCRLKELRLSYNYISKINSNFISDLKDLQSVDLSFNRLNNLSEHCFTNSPNLVYLNLEGNIVETVAERTFSHLPKLEVLDLQNNRLSEFSTEYFDVVSNDDISLSVNVSYNRITSLVGGESKLLINILDLSHNLLEMLSKSFFDCVGPSIRQLVLSHNHLTHIDNYMFSSCSALQILILHDNYINVVKRRAFGDLSALQILDLSQNRLAQLSAEQFATVRHLRHLRLDGNRLRSLPRDAFRNTVLEYLDLSNNQLSIFPSSALAQVGFTLRRLELAQNHLEYLDAAMFHATSFLQELGLAHNSLTVLSDNTFAGLSRLARLDLSQNTIKTNFKELFHNVPRLRRLILAGAGLKAVPHLPLANLTELDLSGNHIASYREPDVRHLSNLRALDLARNRFTSLQPAMWVALPNLIRLDVSHNPLVRVTRGSFEGLAHLLHLRMDHLYHLEAVEPKAFRALRSLRALTLPSPTTVGKIDVSLADILSCTLALETLEVHVQVSRLETQLHGVQAPKLRALELRGEGLESLSADALAALGGQRALTLRLRGTGVRVLPAGLLQPLATVPHLALDLSENALVALAPATLYPNLTGWHHLATKLLPGGLVVASNPLRCGCGVAWVGAWLRRWSAEVGAWEGGARAAARRSDCAGGPAGAAGRTALLALEADAAACHASALSSRAHAARAALPALPHALCLAVLLALT